MPFVTDSATIEGDIEALGLVTTLTSTATTLNGVLVLTNASGTLQEVIGTATGYSIQLPNATTLIKGTNYKFVNSSTQNVDIDNASAVRQMTLPPNSKCNLLLLTNTTANGTWAIDDNMNQGDVELTQTNNVGVTSTTDSIITGFTLTPPAGTYECSFSLSCTFGSTSGRTYYASFFMGDAVVAESPRPFYAGAANIVGTMSSMAKITVNGTQAIDVRCRVNNTTGGTVTVGNRQMYLRRIGS